MASIMDISTAVGTLVTYFTMGGNDAAIELIKGIAVNSSLKLVELKDELLGEPEVIQAVEEFQQNPVDTNLKSQLENILNTALEQHPAFQQGIQVQGDINAEKGSVAAAVIQNSTIKITND